MSRINLLIDDTADCKWNLVLAHGAGADMRHPFMHQLAEALKKHSFRVLRFNFPYRDRGRKMPVSNKEDISTWKEVIKQVSIKFTDIPLFISGKSYGGRMASHVALEIPKGIKGIIYFGFPLHAPGKPGTARAGHLSSISIPQLFIQGDRDSLADFDLISSVVNPLNEGKMYRVKGGDHSLNIPKSQKVPLLQTLQQVSAACRDFATAYSS